VLDVILNKQAVGGKPPKYAPASHVTLTFDLLTLKVVSESRVTWATFVPVLFFRGLSVLDFDPMYATDRQMSDRQTSGQKVKGQLAGGGAYCGGLPHSLLLLRID